MMSTLDASFRLKAPGGAALWYDAAYFNYADVPSHLLGRQFRIMDVSWFGPFLFVVVVRIDGGAVCGFLFSIVTDI